MMIIGLKNTSEAVVPSIIEADFNVVTNGHRTATCEKTNQS